MKLLAFDTATDACSMALQIDDQRLVDHRIVSQQHAQMLLPALDALLADAGLTPSALDGVVFGRGPGSFTGVRIAAAAAQGLAMAADIGVIGVSSLACMARAALDEPERINATLSQPAGPLPLADTLPIFATLDARMGEIYAALFHASRSEAHGWQLRAVSAEAVQPPENSLMQHWTGEHAHCLVVGSGLAAYAELLTTPPAPDVTITTVADVLPNAGALLELALPIARAGQWQSAGDAIPTYLRDKVALTQREQQAQRTTSR